jgi:lysine-N-methylase
MSFPLVQLPVVQNWDCHGTGSCCKEHRINLTEEEARRIEAQGWDRDTDLGGYRPVRRSGWLWRRPFLNRRSDGGCVFLSSEGRCRIHERHGYDAKPLACRLFPFVLIPVADHWRVGLRYSCPSAAASKGRPLTDHDADLRAMADRLAEREGLTPQPDGALIRPPPLDRGQRVEWPVLLRVLERFLALLRDRSDPVERRWRKCLLLADQVRRTQLDQLPPGNLEQTLTFLATVANTDTPKDPHHVPTPSTLGRVIFRFAAALYTRSDHGPNRGAATRGRLRLLVAALRFARGSGRVPQMHRLLPEATFEDAEEPRGPLDPAAEEVLERYYLTKVGSFQFCGPASFGLSFWEGLQGLAVTVPLILWAMRLFRDAPREQAAIQALSIVDHHFGFNPLLASWRMRLGFRTLTRRGDLARLIAWYSR